MKSTVIHSFPPIADARAEILILGSMASKASLAAGQYYAHPHNYFWPLICELLKLPADTSYLARTKALLANRIALWDVIKSCRRSSSLDADIDPDSIIANDFATFYRAHPKITQVYFNGSTVEKFYRRHVMPSLDKMYINLQYFRLPSTSPANASWSRQRKRQAWMTILK